MRGDKAMGEKCMAASPRGTLGCPTKKAPQRRRGRKSGAFERRTRTCNRRNKRKGPLSGDLPLSETDTWQPRTARVPASTEESGAPKPTGSVAKAARPAAESADPPAEFFRLTEQLKAAELAAVEARAQLQDFKQLSKAAQVQAYNDGFVTGMAVSEQAAAAAATVWAAVAARDGKIAELQAQLTTARTAAAAQVAELQAQLTTARTAAAAQVAELQAQLTTARTAVAAQAHEQLKQLEDTYMQLYNLERHVFHAERRVELAESKLLAQNVLVYYRRIASRLSAIMDDVSRTAGLPPLQ